MKTQRIPVISLYGPWANWVALGWKKIETRTHPRFQSLVGRRIGIHVAVKWDDAALDAAAPFLGSIRLGLSKSFLKIGGAIIATASVSDHRLLLPQDARDALIECKSVQRYGLFLQNVEMLAEMIPAKGKQGIWYADIPV